MQNAKHSTKFVIDGEVKSITPVPAPERVTVDCDPITVKTTVSWVVNGEVSKVEVEADAGELSKDLHVDRVTGTVSHIGGSRLKVKLSS